MRGRDPPIGKVQVVGIFLKRPISAPWKNGLVGCWTLVRRPRPDPGPKGDAHNHALSRHSGPCRELAIIAAV